MKKWGGLRYLREKWMIHYSLPISCISKEYYATTTSIYNTCFHWKILFLRKKWEDLGKNTTFSWNFPWFFPVQHCDKDIFGYGYLAESPPISYVKFFQWSGMLSCKLACAQHNKKIQTLIQIKHINNTSSQNPKSDNCQPSLRVKRDY